MRSVLIALFCVFFISVSLYAKNEKGKKETVTFYIEAMDCDHCIKKIEKNISFEKGVTDLKCDLSTRTAVVTYKSDKTSKIKLAAAFKKIGMEAVEVDKGSGCKVDTRKDCCEGDKH